MSDTTLDEKARRLHEAYAAISRGMSPPAFISSNQPLTHDHSVIGTRQLPGHSHGITPYLSEPERALRVLGMRLHWRDIAEGQSYRFIDGIEFIDARRTGAVMTVYLVVKGKPLLIEDDPALFPSDTLITKIRTLTP